MNQLQIFGLTLIALTVAQTTHAQSQIRPLFDAFTTFCVDTRAEPGAARVAVEAAGGKPHTPPGGAASILKGAVSMTFTSWDVTVDGHKMLVTTGTAYASRQSKTAQDLDDCNIFSGSNEDASIEAIRGWVDVQPLWTDTAPHDNKLAPDFALYEYAFQRDGREWSLFLGRDPTSGSLQLTVVLPRSPPNSN
ncbi:MAG TPA: hypothetical protein VN932_02785 [Rhizomicrobium sp.]|nr:hypothetical protein [Rhizomicrobium sp.]